MEIFQYTFMIKAFLAGTMIAAIASSLGMFVVVKRFSMLSDALAHISLLGVAIGFLTALSPSYSSLVFTLTASWVIEYLRQHNKLYSDSILSIFLSGSLALAIIIVSASSSFNTSLFDYLFGSIVAIDDDDIVIITLLGLICAATLYVNFQRFLYIAFDEESAKASGINTTLLNYLLISLVSVVISVSIKIVGALLIGAMMVIPAIIAMQFSKNFRSSVVYAIFIAMVSVIGGLFISYYASLPSGATIVVLLLCFFILSLLFKPKRY